MNVAFWNLGQSKDMAILADFIHHRTIDLVAVAECGFDPEDFRAYFQRRFASVIHTPALSNRIIFLSRFSSQLYRPVLDTPYLSVIEYNPPAAAALLIGACHLRSKLHSTESDQTERALEVAEEFRGCERRVGHKRSILMGDFNMNPFERGLIGARSFHAVMDSRIAESGSRRIDRQDRDYFYNPMWHLMGNRSNNARGTFFYDVSDPHNFYWNTFDQVLVRPDLLQIFDEDSLQVVDSISSKSLLTKSSSRIEATISDHLPIFFTLKSL